MASSLRNTTLDAALQFIPTYSFTRQAIKQGYLVARRSAPSLPSGQARIGNEDANAEVDIALDMIFGPGEAGGKDLVGAWERMGLEDMIEGERKGSAVASSSSSSTSNPSSSTPCSSSSSSIPASSDGPTDEGHTSNIRGLKDRLRRRLEYSERTTGEGLVQVSQES